MEGKKVVGPSSGTSSGPSSRCISRQRFFATRYRSYLSYAIASLGICTGLRRMLVAAHPHSTPPARTYLARRPMMSWASLSGAGRLCGSRSLARVAPIESQIYASARYTQLEAERELGLPCWDRGGARRNRRPLSVREGLHRTVYVSIHLYVKRKARQPATRASGAHRLCLHCPCLHSSMYSVCARACDFPRRRSDRRAWGICLHACVCMYTSSIYM